ncbi:MAG: CBS domain-containing protein, partial [Moorella sp. (in: firmicutes)]
MVKDVAVVHPDDVVTDVVGLFVQRNVTSAVVVDEKNTV